MIGRNTSRLILRTLLAALSSILVFAQPAFAQNPTGRETPKPVQKEKAKSAAKPAKSGGSGGPGKSAKPTKSTKKSTKPWLDRATAPKLAPTGAKLTIVAPPGALVEVDGKSRGVVGTDGDLVLIGLAPGDHQLRVSADGYEPWRGTFVMSAASTRFEAPMSKKPTTGRLALTSNEPGTEILIDEKYSAKSLPGQVMYFDGLLPGVRQLRAVKPGFREWRGTAVIRANETAEVNIELKPFLDPEMLRIPEGAFVRGNDKGAKDQRPTHQVITPAFEISRGEVTNMLYKMFVDATGHPAPRGVGYGWNGNKYPEGQGDLPVVFVTWEDAVAFCKWLSEQTGRRSPAHRSGMGEGGETRRRSIHNRRKNLGVVFRLARFRLLQRARTPEPPRATARKTRQDVGTRRRSEGDSRRRFRTWHNRDARRREKLFLSHDGPCRHRVPHRA